MTDVSHETFTCSVCRRTYPKIRPDAEALAEMERDYGPVPIDQVAILCDDCNTLFLKWLAEKKRTAH